MRTIEYHDASVRVRYAETDQMGVVYHANFFVWFEVGRVELIRALGIEYKRMEKEDDCHIVVADAHCRYQLPARYDEVLRIRTRIAESRNRIIKFSYEVFRNADGKLLATGETTHIICGGNGRPKMLPTKYQHVFKSVVAPQPDRTLQTATSPSHSPSACALPSTFNSELSTSAERNPVAQTNPIPHRAIP